MPARAAALDDRRHLTTGARAIIAARAARLNGQTQTEAAEVSNLIQPRISDAMLVLDWAPALADAVIAGRQEIAESHTRWRSHR